MTAMDFCQSESDFISPTPITGLPLYSPDHHATFSKSVEPPLPLYIGAEEYQQPSHYPTTTDTDQAPSSSCDLQQILLYYQSQPDLLQLILSSKLQEDRRRTEEARLRAKELDWLLLQQPLHQSMYAEDQPALPMKRRRDSPLFNDTSDDLDQTLLFQQMTNNLPSDDTPPPEQRPRKRREMQAITKLVETKDPAYSDGYFWRNNGNTTQKKTGNKSVYFKCSNSTKGCPVNKTTTYSYETGDYVIKYRGEHLPECGKVQHIVEI